MRSSAKNGFSPLAMHKHSTPPPLGWSIWMQARPTLHSRSPSKRPLTGAVLLREVTAAPGLSRPRARSARRPTALLVCTAGPRVQERALTLGQEEVHLKGRGPPRAHSTEAHTDKPSSSPRLPPGRCHPRGGTDTLRHLPPPRELPPAVAGGCPELPPLGLNPENAAEKAKGRV